MVRRFACGSRRIVSNHEGAEGLACMGIENNGALVVRDAVTLDA